MRKKINGIVSFIMVLCLAACLINPAYAAMQSDAPNADFISVENNAIMPDNIEISGLMPGDIVKVYTTAAVTIPIGKATVGYGKTSAVISIKQLGTVSGTVYISVTSLGKTESVLTPKSYSAEKQSNPPSASEISVINNAGMKDIIEVSGLISGDIVKVYTAPAVSTLIGAAAVPKGKTSATVTIDQLGTNEGYIYVSVTSTGKTESDLTKKEYLKESRSSDLKAGNVFIVNNSGISDIINVIGLLPGDVVKVYAEYTGDSVIAGGTVKAGRTQAEINVEQLGKEAGTVYLSVTHVGEQESDRIPVSYDAEETDSRPLNDENVMVINNPGDDDDWVKAAKLLPGDIVRVYANEADTMTIGSGKAEKDKTSVTFKVTGLNADGGKIYISVANTGKSEGSRKEISYGPESDSAPPLASDIIVINNAGSNDIIKVAGLAPGYIVKAYPTATGGTDAGSAAVQAGKTGATITIKQLGAEEGKVYISVKAPGKRESLRTEVAYLAEGESQAPSEDNITVTNNAVIADTVKVAGLVPGSVVKVYANNSDENSLAKGVVSSNKTETTINVKQLGSAEGYAYITVTQPGKTESKRVGVHYDAEAVSRAPSADNITVANNSGKNDTVVVSGIFPKTVVKVYSTSESGVDAIGTATAGSGKNEAVVSIKQLGAAAGSVYVSLTEPNKAEGPRTEKKYAGEQESSPISPGNVEVVNNAGINDTVAVKNLLEGSVIKVYADDESVKALAAASVPKGKTTAVVSIRQIGADGGSIFVTVAMPGKAESSRVQISFDAEVKTVVFSPSSITVTNNLGTSDQVKVTGLSSGDIVKIYLPDTGKLIGSATVGKGASEAAIIVKSLAAEGGTVSATLTSVGKLESDPLAVDYDPEQETVSEMPVNIVVINNVGNDYVIVYGLNAGDIIKVYDSEGKVIAKGTVAEKQSQVILTLKQLGAAGGQIYITRTGLYKLESDRAAAAFPAE